MTTKRTTTFALSMALLLAPVLHAGLAAAQGDSGKIGVAVEGVQRTGTEVTGWIVNRTQNEVTDVRLLVQENWFWTNEKHPGDDNPGSGTMVRVPEAIPAGGRVKFRYDMPAPLPERSDGHFETEVKVMGFTERWLEQPAAVKVSPSRVP